jgi:hypothetical protein
MISMLPLKISSFLERAPLPQTHVAPARPRLAAAEAPLLAPVAPAPPDHDRRVNGDRRVLERRESGLPAVRDTRSSHGRRRSPGRRAEDQQAPALRKAISIQA